MATRVAMALMFKGIGVQVRIPATIITGRPRGTQTPIPAKKAQSHVPMMAICQNKTMAFA